MNIVHDSVCKMVGVAFSKCNYVSSCCNLNPIHSRSSWQQIQTQTPSYQKSKNKKINAIKVVLLQDVVHNQVLVSATVSAIAGQLSKPFSSAVLGKGLNWRLIFASGGMPSTHSASVVAAATALGLDRGLSDSLFGFSVVIAGIVMYDSQGVRRAVGKQAEVINDLVSTNLVSPVSQDGSFIKYAPSESSNLLEKEIDQIKALNIQKVNSYNSTAEDEYLQKASQSIIDRKLSSYNLQKVRLNGECTELSDGADITSSKLDESLPSSREREIDVGRLTRLTSWKHIPLKQSVGHTKIEVLVGGIVGFVTTLGIHWIIKV